MWHRSQKALLWLGIPILLWIAIAWAISDFVIQRRIAVLLADNRQSVERRLESIVLGLANNLAVFHGVPAALGRDRAVINVLGRFRGESQPSALPIDERVRRWTANLELRKLDESLEASARDINALSVIWVMNGSGDCIAASNFGTAESFVGTNYFDRTYFRDAAAGKFGHQFAVGRKTPTPRSNSRYWRSASWTTTKPA